MAANPSIPLQADADESFPAQIDGTGIYSVHARERSRGRRAWLYSIVRFDTVTRKRRKVFDAGAKQLGDFRVGGGKLVARIRLSSRTIGVVSVPLDGSPSTMLATSRWRTVSDGEGSRFQCGTYLSPSSISPAGDVVIESDVIPCRSGYGPRKFMIYRADGTRAEVGDELADSDQLDGMNDPIHTQLAGDRLLVSDGSSRFYDLATGVMTINWVDGVDHSLIAPDGSLWLSAFGTTLSDRFWTTLTRATAPFDSFAGLASNTAGGERGATRYLPLSCGENVVIVSGRIDGDGDDTDGDIGAFGWYGNLRFAGLMKFEVFTPDGTLLRTLKNVRMRQVLAVGCDGTGVTLAGIGKKRYEYARVAL